MENLQQQAANTSVKLNLCHNISELKMPEIRFDLTQTVMSVKQSIERRYGTSAEQMELVLQDSEGNNICSISDNTAKLGFYGPQDGYWIHVLDLDPNSTLNNLDDVSLVKKFEIDEKDYDKLTDNFRKFKTKLLQANPQLIAQQKTQVIDPEHQKENAEKIQLGQRCQIKENKNRGEVKYIGKIPNLGQGFYVGVKLDEPFGKNDGSYVGVKYFECGDKYGIFLRPDKIEVGDFPELDIDDELDEI